jgi:pimeloyl-ACP methyl ester carboxylesterase
MSKQQDTTSDTASFSARLADWRARGERREFAGHRVFVHQAGDWSDATRPTLTLIHGFPTSSWDWHRLWPELEPRFRLLALDLLGYGFSDKPVDHHYSIAEQADIVAALWRDLGLFQSHVLAHDYGDTVTQELLARQQDEASSATRIASIALLNGGVFPEAQRIRPIQRMLAGPMGAIVAGLLGPGRFRRSFESVFAPGTRPSDVELDEFWALISQKGGQRIAHRLIRYLHERKQNRARWVGALQKTPVPQCFIVGMADPGVREGNGGALSRAGAAGRGHRPRQRRPLPAAGGTARDARRAQGVLGPDRGLSGAYGTAWLQIAA